MDGPSPMQVWTSISSRLYQEITDFVTGKPELKCGRYTTEEAQLVSFLATTILQERRS